MNSHSNSFPEVHVIGAGGLSRDFYACFNGEIKIQGFWDDGVKKGTIINNIPVLGNLDEFCSLTTPMNYVIVVGNPNMRKQFALKLNSSVHFSISVVHSLARIFDKQSVQIQNGCILFPHSIITCDVSIGANTLIHTGCSIHHDSKVGAHCVLMPGSRLTGNVIVGDEVFVGANVAIANGMKIGNGEKII